MLDGRFEPELLRSLAEGQISASDLARDHESVSADPVVLKVWLAAVVTVVTLCVVHLA